MLLRLCLLLSSAAAEASSSSSPLQRRKALWPLRRSGRGGRRRETRRRAGWTSSSSATKRTTSSTSTTGWGGGGNRNWEVKIGGGLNGACYKKDNDGKKGKFSFLLKVGKLLGKLFVLTLFQLCRIFSFPVRLWKLFLRKNHAPLQYCPKTTCAARSSPTPCAAPAANPSAWAGTGGHAAQRRTGTTIRIAIYWFFPCLGFFFMAARVILKRLCFAEFVTHFCGEKAAPIILPNFFPNPSFCRKCRVAR